ncbi:hypothetical protein FOVSG1_006700 [Fusarium oxysporum f. sp. vasinfectum]
MSFVCRMGLVWPSLDECLDKRKRKRNTADRAPTKSTKRHSSKKRELKTAAGESDGNSKKRGGINKATTTNLSSPKYENDDYTKKVQERNRIASNKFRAKKKEEERKLESEEEDMERINRDLSTCVTDLTLQVHDLKMKLLQHTDCDCALIQEYIANEAIATSKTSGTKGNPTSLDNMSIATIRRDIWEPRGLTIYNSDDDLNEGHEST